jgi:hypothetical protein
MKWKCKFEKIPTPLKTPNPKAPTEHCLALSDIVRISNLSPTDSFLGEPYMYPSTSNGSPLLATMFYCC